MLHSDCCCFSTEVGPVIGSPGSAVCQFCQNSRQEPFSSSQATMPFLWSAVLRPCCCLPCRTGTAQRAGKAQAVGEMAPVLALKSYDSGTVKLEEAIRKGPMVVMVLRGNPGYQCPLCTRPDRSQARQADPSGPRPDANVCKLLRPRGEAGRGKRDDRTAALPIKPFGVKTTRSSLRPSPTSPICRKIRSPPSQHVFGASGFYPGVE